MLHRRACATPAQATHLRRYPQLVWDTTVWNKLWRREMWDRAGLRYAEGRWLNDFYPSIRAHVYSRQVDVLGDRLYYWRIRNDPTTSVTDRRLTDPVARLKSFEDRMFAIKQARRLLADELPVPGVLRAFDFRLLRSDFPIYLPYYTESDDSFRRAVVTHIGEMLREFAIDPRRHPLGLLLQNVYAAVAAEQYDQLEALLDRQTRVTADPVRRQYTTLQPGRRPSSPLTAATGAHQGPVRRRLTQWSKRAVGAGVPLPGVDAQARIDRVEFDHDSTRMTIHGVVRVREQVSDIEGDWTAAAAIQTPRPTAAILRRFGRQGRRLARLLRPRQVVGEEQPVSAPPDQVLHPLVRAGWRPFTAGVDLAALKDGGRRMWRLAVVLRSGGMRLAATTTLARTARRSLPGGVAVAEDVDVVPAADKSGELTFRRQPSPIRLREVRRLDGDANAVELHLSGPALATGAASIWLQTPGSGQRLAEVAAGPTVQLALPENGGEAGSYEFWYRAGKETGRLRVDADFRAVRVRDLEVAGEPLEAVVHPTSRGRAVLTLRPPRLEAAWLRPAADGEAVLLGGVGQLTHEADGKPPTLEFRCAWTNRLVQAPVEVRADGWQARVPLAELTTSEFEPNNRQWPVVAIDSSGASHPVCVAITDRPRYPLVTEVAGHSLQLGLGEGDTATLGMAPDGLGSHWRQFRKIQRSLTQAAS